MGGEPTVRARERVVAQVDLGALAGRHGEHTNTRRVAARPVLDPPALGAPGPHAVTAGLRPDDAVGGSACDRRKQRANAVGVHAARLLRALSHSAVTTRAVARSLVAMTMRSGCSETATT